MTVKTPLKVKPRIKKYSPLKFILHEVLRPCYHPPIDSLIYWTMIELKLSYIQAESVVYKALDYIEENGLTYRDRDKLNLPNISERYPRYDTSFWNSPIVERD